MKKLFFFFVASLISTFTFSQWQASGTNIYYSSGAVNIGTSDFDSGFEFKVKDILLVRNVPNSFPASVGVGVNGFLDVKRNSTIKAARISQQGSGNILEMGTTTDGTDATFETSFVLSSSGNLGLGTDTPSERLEIDGNLLIKKNNAIILSSPNGTKFKITVDDSGNLSTSFLSSKKSITSNSDVLLFPNPAENTLSVELNGAKHNIGKATVIDINGRILLINNFESNSFRINTSNLRSGSYFLKLQSHDGSMIGAEKFTVR